MKRFTHILFIIGICSFLFGMTCLVLVEMKPEPTEKGYKLDTFQEDTTLMKYKL